MGLRIKNFAKFQHFKDRSPPWIKLYRDILDDPDWHELDDSSSKILVMLWLIASEDENKDGNLPDSRKLCFRLRVTEKELQQAIFKLIHWVEQLDNEVISSRYQSDAPEERRGERDTCSPSSSESADDGFATFWEQYPKKVAKPQAVKAWKKIKPAGHVLADLMEALEKQKASGDWLKDRGQFIPHPATWLNGRRWEDEAPQGAGQTAAQARNPIFAGAI